MGPDRALMDDAIRNLASFERASASPGEQRAAEWIAEKFRELGLEPVVEEGRAHGGVWWPLGLLNAVAVVGAFLRPRWLGRLLAAVAAVAMVDDLDHRSRWFRRAFLPHRPTYNVHAIAGDAAARRTVLVVAHHDAAHGGRIFDTSLLRAVHDRWPALYDRFNRWPPLMWGVIAAPVLVAAGERRHSVRLGLGTIATMVDIGRSPVAPGANDNLAAVGALLALARRLRDEPVEGLRVILLSTGSEESNSEGMQEYGRAHFGELPRETTDVVALECLGSGTVTVAESEGFLLRHYYDDELKDLATACAQLAGVPVRRGLHTAFTSDAQIAVH